MEKDIFLGSDTLISQALKKFNAAGEKVLLVLDDKNGGKSGGKNESKKLIGVVTDGDIRRAVLSGYSIDEPITDIYNKDPHYIAESKLDPEHVRKILLEKRIDLLPVSQ